MNIHLGKTATDRITGFTGTVVGFCTYVTGCDLYLILPKCGKNNEYPKGQWIDEPRLEFKQAITKPMKKKRKKPGGMKTPPLDSYDVDVDEEW